jgi:hypothetical protein
MAIAIAIATSATSAAVGVGNILCTTTSVIVLVGH